MSIKLNMNRLYFPAISLFLTVASLQAGSFAQPALPPTPRQVPPLFIPELEQFLKGRTLLGFDFKGATLEEVAAALSQSSGQKIAVRPQPAPDAADLALRLKYKLPLSPPPAPLLFTYSSPPKPFWEAVRDWQGAALRDHEADLDPATPATIPNSLGVTKNPAGWWLQPDNSLAEGRALAIWPFLIIATDLKRGQEGRLRPDGLRNLNLAANAPAEKPKGNTVKSPTPEADRWLDTLTLSGQILIEPKLNPSALRCEIFEATDDKGNDLHYSGEVPLRESALGRSDLQSIVAGNDKTRPVLTGVVLKIPLRSKPAMGKRLKKLRGVLRFNVVTKAQHWETTQLDKPTDGTISQNGGDFNVQFQGLRNGTGDMWIANFSAKSRGSHLEQMWRDRPAPIAPTVRNGDVRTGEGIEAITAGRWSNLASSYTIGTTFPSEGAWGNILNFEGTPQMTLVDEKGASFEISLTSQNITLLRDTPGAPPTVLSSPDVSPLPDDVAQNWTYTEKRTLYFNPSYDPATRGRRVVGKPAKLTLDLPLERREVEVPFEFTDLPLPPS